MMTLGYLFCYKLFGMRACGFHLVSVLLHVLVVWLVFVLAERLTGDRVYAFVAAALFALHPIHTESVDWIAAVTDLEVTFFLSPCLRVLSRLGAAGGRAFRPGLCLRRWAHVHSCVAFQGAGDDLACAGHRLRTLLA